MLDALGYVTFRRWKLYGEESLAGREAALWLQEKSLMLEHAGETLSRYEVERLPGSDKLRGVGSPTLFETSERRNRPQARLFGLQEVLGDGWLKALKLEEYAPRRSRRPQAPRSSAPKATRPSPLPTSSSVSPAETSAFSSTRSRHRR